MFTDAHVKAVISAYKDIKKDHNKLTEMLIEFIDDPSSNPALVAQAASWIYRTPLSEPLCETLNEKMNLLSGP